MRYDAAKQRSMLPEDHICDVRLLLQAIKHAAAACSQHTLFAVEALHLAQTASQSAQDSATATMKVAMLSWRDCAVAYGP